MAFVGGQVGVSAKCQTAENDVNADEIRYWTEICGPEWVRLQSALERELGPLGDRAIDALDPRDGERLVDVGCGCGHTSCALAQAVGPSGAVLGVDVSGPMLAVARRHAREMKLSNVRFIEADAQSLDFGPEGYDGVFSRFGTMFFDNAVAAFSNLCRALKPGGRLSFVCWRPREEIEWVTVPLKAALRSLGLPPPNPSTAFSFADPDYTHSVLASAGFTNILITPLDLKTGGSLDEVMEIIKIGGVGTMIREYRDRADAAFADVRSELRKHETPCGVFLNAATWIVTARRSVV